MCSRILFLYGHPFEAHNLPEHAEVQVALRVGTRGFNRHYLGISRDECRACRLPDSVCVFVAIHGPTDLIPLPDFFFSSSLLVALRHFGLTWDFLFVLYKFGCSFLFSTLILSPLSRRLSKNLIRYNSCMRSHVDCESEVGKVFRLCMQGLCLVYSLSFGIFRWFPPFHNVYRSQLQ